MQLKCKYLDKYGNMQYEAFLHHDGYFYRTWLAMQTGHKSEQSYTLTYTLSQASALPVHMRIYSRIRIT